MERTGLRLLSWVTVVLCSESAVAAPLFLGLGYLPGGTSSGANGVSPDGRYVVGGSNFAGSGSRHQAFRWSREEGMVGLGPLASEFGGSAASDLSADGELVVGAALLGDVQQPAQWTVGNDLPIIIPEVPEGAIEAVSSTGSVVVGTFREDTQFGSPPRAFLWNAASGLKRLDESLTGVRESYAVDLSADGTIVAGAVRTSEMIESFRWSESGGLMTIDDLPGGFVGSTPEGISPDGGTIVGASYSEFGYEGFYWNSNDGTNGFGDLPGGDYFSVGLDVSAFGRIAVGYSISAESALYLESDAFLWDFDHGMRRLFDYLAQDLGLASELSGWRLLTANAISSDGLSIVGSGVNPSGQYEAWYAQVPEPGASALALLGTLLACFGARRHVRR